MLATFDALVDEPTEEEIIQNIPSSVDMSSLINRINELETAVERLLSIVETSVNNTVETTTEETQTETKTEVTSDGREENE